MMGIFKSTINFNNIITYLFIVFLIILIIYSINEISLNLKKKRNKLINFFFHKKLTGRLLNYFIDDHKYNFKHLDNVIDDINNFFNFKEAILVSTNNNIKNLFSTSKKHDFNLEEAIKHFDKKCNRGAQIITINSCKLLVIKRSNLFIIFEFQNDCILLKDDLLALENEFYKFIILALKYQNL